MPCYMRLINKKTMNKLSYILILGFFAIVVILFASFQNRASKYDKPERFGFGKSATEAQIAAIDIDVRPDGQGLPDGQGTVSEGAAIYKVKCAVCHGATGREGPQDVLVGGPLESGFAFGESVELSRKKTIGNYWPYASTLYDYTYRAMPQNLPGSLKPDEVYGLVAFLLHENGIIEEDMVMNQTSLPQVEMPAERYFIGGEK